MKLKMVTLFWGLMIFTLLLSSCSSISPSTIANAVNENTPTLTPQPVLVPGLWIDPNIPMQVMSGLSRISEANLLENQGKADLLLKVRQPSESVKNEIGHIQWVYALEAPFPTLTDDLSLDEIQRIWKGNSSSEDPLDVIQVSEETRKIFDALWGNSSSQTVVTVAEEQLQSNDFTAKRNWAIVPFEQITPRWKVIKIAGLSPLDKPLNVDAYALTVNFSLTSDGQDNSVVEAGQKVLSMFPKTNRDESKMTVLMMTGTTAITRAIAYKMEIKGLDYPIEQVLPWFKNADLIHVSNEISFNPDCPFPDPYQHGLQFCASPRYLQTLQDLGVNVVEVTGNHENDYGPEYFVSTLKTYKDLEWAVFGGGTTPDEARQPVKVEVNGNKIAFIGCNVAGPTSDWVTKDRAGTATCDMDYIHDQIKQLKSAGYVVVTTFQHYELYVYMYGELYAKDFQDAAAAGADIVNGSQAHYAMGMQFVGNSLIHYGLGNFLFDQMSYDVVGEKIRREFIDRHVIYDGKYMNTELKTALLTDWAQPVPMTEEERTSFLTDIFKGSKWK